MDLPGARPPYTLMKSETLILALAVFTLAAILGGVNLYFTPLPALLLLVVRWLAIATILSVRC